MDNTTYLAAFRSRAQTMNFFQAAKQSNIPCSIVNTPREASVGCGISVSYAPEYHYAIQSVFYRGGFSAFIGYFCMTRVNGHLLVNRI